MSEFSKYFKSNCRSWNTPTAVHKDSAFYDLEGFKMGKSSLSLTSLPALFTSFSANEIPYLRNAAMIIIRAKSKI